MSVFTSDILTVIQKYDKLREQKKLIENEMKECSAVIQAYAEKNGEKDAKGSFYAEDDQYIIGRVSKKSIKLNPERAIAYLKKWGHVDAIDIIEQVDEDKLGMLVESGEISMEDFKKLTDTKETFSVYVGAKEEMPIIEQKEVTTSAASSRNRFKVKKKVGA